MANLAFYKSFLGIETNDAVCEYLLGTFLETNYTAQFFVNWEKALRNRNKYRGEFALLQSLHRSSNIQADFGNLIKRYPEVIKVIPSLLALRESSLKLIELLESEIRYQTISFSKSSYLASELDVITDFVTDSGLLGMLAATESFADYALGVEVGLDSNARKNRSGDFLEAMVGDILNGLNLSEQGCRLIKQTKFKTLKRDFDVQIPDELLESKADFVLIRGKRALNIEANFYSGSGSKPSEIVNSYANRNRLLKNSGGLFVWLTDGPGWRLMHNPLKTGVIQIDYVLNANLLRRGALNEILASF